MWLRLCCQVNVLVKGTKCYIIYIKFTFLLVWKWSGGTTKKWRIWKEKGRKTRVTGLFTVRPYIKLHPAPLSLCKRFVTKDIHVLTPGDWKIISTKEILSNLNVLAAQALRPHSLFVHDCYWKVDNLTNAKFAVVICRYNAHKKTAPLKDKHIIMTNTKLLPPHCFMKSMLT